MRNNSANENKRESADKMWALFHEIMLERRDSGGWLYCFETGNKIPKYYYDSTTIYHHLLEKEKSKYPEYKYEKWNIYTVLPNVHELTHNNIDKTPNLKAERELLISKIQNNEMDNNIATIN